MNREEIFKLINETFYQDLENFFRKIKEKYPEKQELIEKMEKDFKAILESDEPLVAFDLLKKIYQELSNEFPEVSEDLAEFIQVFLNKIIKKLW
ncbi:hypothetical protein HRbin35_00116 [bacterium HR35]|nr:hypothetical protein HRbin35_00116 [bacterium HR35]